MAKVDEDNQVTHTTVAVVGVASLLATAISCRRFWQTIVIVTTITMTELHYHDDTIMTQNFKDFFRQARTQYKLIKTIKDSGLPSLLFCLCLCLYLVPLRRFFPFFYYFVVSLIPSLASCFFLPSSL